MALSSVSSGLRDVLIHFKNGSSEQEAVEMAAKAGVRVYGLSEFLVSGKAPQMPATVLLGYATMSEEDLEKGMKRLAEAWNGREKILSELHVQAAFPE